MICQKSANRAAIVLLGGALILSLAFIAACEKSESQSATPTAGATYANANCPMMGRKIDPSAVTGNLVREFEGQKVAFCCGKCPGKWDKLTNDEKTQKLAASIVKPAE